jgi:rhodanese-related sulfurtransferase
MGQQGYAGDVDPAQAWEMLSKDPDAVLVDVRTDAEWRYVGLPELSGIGKKAYCVSWQLYPDMRHNADFAAQVAQSGITADKTLLLICRSGQRSRDAALALTATGFSRCYNVAEGFEGPRDAQFHRGGDGGWKARGLPWVQG